MEIKKLNDEQRISHGNNSQVKIIRTLSAKFIRTLAHT